MRPPPAISVLGEPGCLCSRWQQGRKRERDREKREDPSQGLESDQSPSLSFGGYGNRSDQASYRVLVLVGSRRSSLANHSPMIATDKVHPREGVIHYNSCEEDWVSLSGDVQPVGGTGRIARPVCPIKGWWTSVRLVLSLASPTVPDSRSAHSRVLPAKRSHQSSWSRMHRSEPTPSGAPDKDLRHRACALTGNPT